MYFGRSKYNRIGKKKNSPIRRLKVGANLATLTRSTLFLLEAVEKQGFSEFLSATGY